MSSVAVSTTMARVCADRGVDVVLFNRYIPGLKAIIINLTTGEVKNIEVKMNMASLGTVSFSEDSKQVIIGSGANSCAIIDVVTGKVLKASNDLNYFLSNDGDKYGIISQ